MFRKDLSMLFLGAGVFLGVVMEGFPKDSWGSFSSDVSELWKFEEY